MLGCALLNPTYACFGGFIIEKSLPKNFSAALKKDSNFVWFSADTEVVAPATFLSTLKNVLALCPIGPKKLNSKVANASPTTLLDGFHSIGLLFAIC